MRQHIAISPLKLLVYTQSKENKYLDLMFGCCIMVLYICVWQAAAGEHGAASQSGRTPICSGLWSPPCGRPGDLSEKCRMQQRRGPETQRGAPEGHSAVPHQSATSSQLKANSPVHQSWTFWPQCVNFTLSCCGNTHPQAASWIVSTVFTVWFSINYWC